MLGANGYGRTYKVKINELLEHLKKNRDEHVDIVIEAQAAFKKATIEKLEQMLELARSGKPISMALGLTVPTVHTDAFDNAIGILEMTARAGEEVIEITSDEYERFVRNRWEWTEKFRHSNAGYSSRL